MARFQREAEVLASLNHRNIAQIYGVEERALVMELVEGENLKGPLPIETALAYARQITDALEAAHEKGITHRDLKPANVRVTPQGVVPGGENSGDRRRRGENARSGELVRGAAAEGAGWEKVIPLSPGTRHEPYEILSPLRASAA
jgi:serine/threonine protein kinase